LSQDNHKLLITGFLNAAKAFPRSIALEADGNIYTYQSLKGNALKIANVILRFQESRFIAVLAAKSLVSCSGILGVLLAGKAYLPLNKKNPPKRSLSMLSEAAAGTILAGKECLQQLKQLLEEAEQEFLVILPDVSNSSGLQEKFPGHQFIFSEEIALEKEEEIPLIGSNDSIAYLLFTSGSTGLPKGVPVKNESVFDYVKYITETFDLSSADRFSQTFDLTFDLSVHDLFVCWNIGACLCMPPADDSPVSLAKYIKEQEISVWFSVPSVALLFQKIRLLKIDIFSGLRYSFFCGEALTESVVKNWATAAGNSKIINLYGPTEATIAIAYYEWKREGQNHCKNGIVPIGSIFKTQEYCIVDENNLPVQQGQKGELLLSGAQVFSGYLNMGEKVKSPFVILNFKNWYKTGDLVMEEANQLHFLGRVDNQVKINGYRVELQEVDHVIGKIVKTEILATIFDSRSNSLVTFIEEGENSVTLEEIFNFCKKILPPYMVPAKIIYLKNMPLNTNGKIDRKNLSSLVHE
jgi:amino acid adenylation domain-containing protein